MGRGISHILLWPWGGMPKETTRSLYSSWFDWLRKRRRGGGARQRCYRPVIYQLWAAARLLSIDWTGEPCALVFYFVTLPLKFPCDCLSESGYRWTQSLCSNQRLSITYTEREMERERERERGREGGREGGGGREEKNPTLCSISPTLASDVPATLITTSSDFNELKIPDEKSWKDLVPLSLFKWIGHTFDVNADMGRRRTWPESSNSSFFSFSPSDCLPAFLSFCSPFHPPPFPQCQLLHKLVSFNSARVANSINYYWIRLGMDQYLRGVSP